MSDLVLVVDDSLTVRMDLVEILEAAGLPTIACATGGEARAALARDRFSLVILDVLLPDADGIDLLHGIRENPIIRDTPVMLLSSEAEIRHRVRGLATGADEYIGKPYEPGYLVARARELLQRGQLVTGLTPESILLIDDSTTFREALREALEAAAYHVLVAGSGEEGLHIAAEKRPVAVIVDGILPGIDGATVIRRIRLDAALRHLPCLLLTASEDLSAELRALDAGADAFVRKEEDTEVILARLSAILRSAGIRDDDQNTSSLLGPKRVLAVDDSETYLQQLAGALRGEGYEVVLARSGEEAMDLMSLQAVDCILLDLVMPGIDGQEMCRRIKAVPVIRDIPIIMLTAVEDRASMIGGLAAGADDYIAKSSDIEILRARIQAQIRRKQSQDETRFVREQLLRKELEAAEARAARETAEAKAALAREQELRAEIDRGKARAALHQTEQQLEFALDAARMGSWELDFSTGHIATSDYCRVNFGLGPDDPVDHYDDVAARVHPDDREARQHAIDLAIQSGGDLDFEYRTLKPAGEIGWVLVRGRGIYQEGRPVRMAGVSLDITKRKADENRLRLLLDELNHRVKNTLVTVQSIALQTRRFVSEPSGFDKTFLARLDALGRAHELLSETSWEGATLDDILGRTLAPYAAEGAPEDHITLSGPKIRLGPNAAVTLNMAFHELATNAAKYGSLTVALGQIAVEWKISNGETGQVIEIDWRETNGPAVSAPRRRGFGSRLIEQGLIHELDGEAELVFRPEGLWCRMKLPLSPKLGRVS
jgi:DNA-binding response OmpR family regulator